MPISQTELQQRIDALEMAISLGVFEVAEKDRVTRYRSLDEMLRTLAWLKNSLSATPTTNPGDRVYRNTAVHDKGLGG